MKSDLLLLIAVYQGRGEIGEVVRGVRTTMPDHPILVVDDGSTDGSSEEAEGAGARVLRHPRNQGKGAALQTGFAYAERHGAAATLTLDADKQHDPQEIPILVAAHRENPQALVIGVRRFDNEVMPLRSRIGNRISTWWIAKFAGRPHTDTQSGFRVYPRALYRDARFRTSRFDTETELLLRAAKLEIPLIEVGIQTIYASQEKQATHFRTTRDTLRIIRLVIGSPWWRIDPPA